MAANPDDVVARFWRGIDSHDWELVGSTLADDFVRIGMRDDEADTCRGKARYLEFVAGVIGRFDHHELRARKIFRFEDGRRAVAECIETIRPPGEPELVMHFINVMEIDAAGLISKLDIYWKTPPRMPPAWITPKAILEGSEGRGKRAQRARSEPQASEGRAPPRPGPATTRRRRSGPP